MPKPSVESRFWSKVDKSGECWLWTGGSQRGHGRISIKGDTAYVHRLAWELSFGAIPLGKTVFQSCGNQLCVRPDHLYLDKSPRYILPFWDNVYIPQDENACWTWKGMLDKDGYGYYRVDKRTRRAHRVSWELANGPIPEGLFVCHKCDNPPCVRSDHLFLGTAQDNARDRGSKNRGRQQQGTSNSMSKLTDESVIEIRALHKAGGWSHSALASKFGVSRRTIGFVVNRVVWKHLP